LAASAATSRVGAGSGTHRFTWAGPVEAVRNSSIQRPISAEEDNTAPIAPIAPMLPALASAADSGTGQAPAIGASRIGTEMPKRRQNASAREVTAELCMTAH